jgi:hypothetical protein
MELKRVNVNVPGSTKKFKLGSKKVVEHMEGFYPKWKQGEVIITPHQQAFAIGFKGRLAETVTACEGDKEKSQNDYQLALFNQKVLDALCDVFQANKTISEKIKGSCKGHKYRKAIITSLIQLGLEKRLISAGGAPTVAKVQSSFGKIE